MKYLTLLIIDENDLHKKQQGTFKDILNSATLAPICIFTDNDLERFQNFIKTLPLNTKFHLLFHLGIKRKKTPNSKYKGEIILNKFSIKLPGLKNHKYYFSQSSDTRKIKGKVFSYSDLVNENSPDGFLKGDVLNENHLVTPANLLYKQFKAVDVYKLEVYDSKNSLNEYLIGKPTIKQILGACIFQNGSTKKEISDVKINFLSPGYSGAYVAVISYQKENQNYRTFQLLKFSKNHDSLLREKIKGSYLYKNALPSNFIGARLDYESIVVDGYLCLLFNFARADDLINVVNSFSNKPSKTSNKELFNLLEVTLNKFNEFILRVGNTIKSKESINPWSHSGFGLKPASRFIIRAKITIQKFIETYKNDHLSKHFYLTTTDLLNLSKYLIPEDDEKGDELINCQSIKVPVGIIHGDLHGRNILVEQEDKELKEIYFIDFALMNIGGHQRNVLLDLAHLCIDFEVELSPQNTSSFSSYIKHSRFFLHQKFTDIKAKNLLKVNLVYKIVNKILVFTLDTYKFIEKPDDPISFQKSKLLLQFHLARLHYLIKRIAFDNVSKEKILFMCRLALDIFQYIEENQEAVLKER